jgi:hypothetical protein
MYKMNIKRELGEFDALADEHKGCDLPLLHPNTPNVKICIKQETADDPDINIEVSF